MFFLAIFSVIIHLQSTSSMEPTFSRQIRFVRFFGGFKIPEPMRFAFICYARAPLTLKKYDAHKTRFIAPIWLSDILRVARFIYNPKVNKSVVVFDAINVVNKAFRPFAGHVQPRQPMRFVNDPFVANSAIPNAFFAAPRYIALPHTFGRAYFPRKKPRVRAISQNFAEFISRHLRVSFVALQYIYLKTTGGQV